MDKHRELIKAEQLRVGYGQRSLLGPTDVSLLAGELVCLMGPNGSGKTTLLRVLAGLIPLRAGSIRYAWKAGQNSGVHPRKMAVVLTDRPWNRSLTAEEVVCLGRYPYSENSAVENTLAARRELDRLHLSHLSARTLDQLSDGQRQLVMIARAFAQQPQVLLMDEPTSHLDLNHRVEIMKRLSDWCRESPGRTVLMATHELDLALQRADRLWVLADGELNCGVPEDLVLNGTLDNLFRLKGFTLKTGKVENTLLGFPVQILREPGVPDYAVLWTRNALERNGHPCRDSQDSDVKVGVFVEGDRINWVLNQNVFSSVEHLLDALRGIRG